MSVEKRAFRYVECADIDHPMHLHSLLALVAQLDVRSTSDQEVTDLIPARSSKILSRDCS